MAGWYTSAVTIRVTTTITAPTITTLMSIDTLPTIVLPPPPPPVNHVPRHRRLWWVLGTIVVIAVATATAVNLLPVPYVALSPGSARATEPLIAVQGAETYPSTGQVMFLTVHLDGISSPVSIAQAAWGWFDDEISVVPESRVLGDASPEENRVQNQQMMVESKDLATLVALRYLGYEVTAHGRGATIIEVVDASPAQGVIEVGETVTAVEGEPVEFSEQLAARIGEHKPDDAVTLAVEGTDGTVRDVTVTLAPRPDNADVGFFGVSSQTRGLDYDLPFEVTIDSGQVGGPSAGLAFTLGVLDVLTPGELTGGEIVATTGTISPDGTVGVVGGVEQKVAAAKDEGATLLLVPTPEYDAAVAAAGDDLRVAAVSTLDEALTALDSLGGNALALPRAPDPGT